MATALVIGGTGFIGGRVVRRFVQAGWNTVSLDMNPDRGQLADITKSVTFTRGDVTKFDDVIRTILLSGKLDCIIALPYFSQAQSAEHLHRALRTNIVGMDNVFEAARLTGVKRVIFASSAANPLDATPGDHPILPTTIYGWSKHFNEIMAAAYSEKYGMTIAGIRPSAVFGAARVEGFILHSTLINEAALGRPVHLDAAPNAHSSLIHVDDVAEAFYQVATASKPRHAEYALTADHVTLEELADIVRGILPTADISFKQPATAAGTIASVREDRIEAEFGVARAPLAQRVLETMNLTRLAAGLTPLGPAGR